MTAHEIVNTILDDLKLATGGKVTREVAVEMIEALVAQERKEAAEEAFREGWNAAQPVNSFEIELDDYLRKWQQREGGKEGDGG